MNDNNRRYFSPEPDTEKLMNNLRITYKDAYFELRMGRLWTRIQQRITVRLGLDLATNAAAPGAIA